MIDFESAAGFAEIAYDRHIALENASKGLRPGAGSGVDSSAPDA
jgi:hypothetical protein